VQSNGVGHHQVKGQLYEIVDLHFDDMVPLISSLVIHSKLALTPTAIYVVGLSKSLASYTLHITSLSPTTGDVLSTANIPSSISDGLTHLMILSHTSTSKSTTSARAVWLERRSIKTFALTPTLNGKPTAIKGSAYKQIIDVGLSEHGQLVAVKTDGSSCILKLETDGSELETIWEYQDSVCYHDLEVIIKLIDVQGFVGSQHGFHFCWRLGQRWLSVHCTCLLVAHSEGMIVLQFFASLFTYISSRKLPLKSFLVTLRRAKVSSRVSRSHSRPVYMGSFAT